MFFHPAERNETDYDDGVVVFEPEQTTFSFCFLYGLDNVVQMAVFALNLFILMAKAFDKEKRFQCCSFYIIITGFSITMVLQSATRLVYSFCTQILLLAQTWGWTSSAAMITDMFSTYYSAVLIFLISYNRYVAYTKPGGTTAIFKRKNLTILLCVAAVTMLGFSWFISWMSDAERSFDSSMGIQVDSVADMTLIMDVNYVFYAIPLLSSWFYVRIYQFLISQRKLVRSAKTQELLDEAEVQNCKQGGMLFIVYMVALLFNIGMCFAPDNSSVEYILLCIQTVISAGPQLGIPLSALVFNAKMRSACKTWLSSLLPSPKKTSRVGSASSIKIAFATNK